MQTVMQSYEEQNRPSADICLPTQKVIWNTVETFCRHFCLLTQNYKDKTVDLFADICLLTQSCKKKISDSNLFTIICLCMNRNKK